MHPAAVKHIYMIKPGVRRLADLCNTHPEVRGHMGKTLDTVLIPVQFFNQILDSQLLLRLPHNFEQNKRDIYVCLFSSTTSADSVHFKQRKTNHYHRCGVWHPQNHKTWMTTSCNTSGGKCHTIHQCIWHSLKQWWQLITIAALQPWSISVQQS